MKKVYIETYGCTLNQADSDIMSALIKDKYKIVETAEESDVVIINTCTVKGTTENKIMARIKNLQKINKKVVVAGCMSANEKKIKKVAPNSPIVGTSSLSAIDQAIDSALLDEAKTFKLFESKDKLPKILMSPIMRIPINDGCTSNCYFCQTKIARPFLRSYSPKTISKWINESVENGASEIQLTSMDSGAYGIDIKTNLISLLNSLSNDNSKEHTEKKYLIRLGMINPDHAMRMLGGIISALKNPIFYKFLHIPTQSGSEKICKEMNRDHTVSEFVDIVDSIRKEIPEVSISTDIIVGYPTETDDDYIQTKELLLKTRPDIINISKFSPRPGTKARELKELDSRIVKERSTDLSIIARKIELENRLKLVGKTYNVLITEKTNSPKVSYKGRNINYIQVVVEDFNGKLGEFVNVKINRATNGTLFGKIV